MPFDKLISGMTGGSSGLSGLLGQSSVQGALGGAASGALVSMLANKKMRKKLSKNAVKVGGAAALAGVGYYAYKKWQDGQQPGASAGGHGQVAGALEPPPVPAGYEAATAEVVVTVPLQLKMVLAMIAAAGADGTIDDQEMTVLVDAIEEAPIDADAKAELTEALNAPPTVEDLARLVEGPEEGSEVYGAALGAIDVDTPAEHLFLKRFSRALELEPALVDELHRVAES